jgi:large subunit ribosomal protein L15
MQINELKPKTKLKKKVQIGRGGKRGKTSGRGTKGQNARAGNKKRPEIRTIIKKLPKLRGYRFNSVQLRPLIVTFEFLEKNFNNSDVVNASSLKALGLKNTKGHKLTKIKILNRGTLTKVLKFEGCFMSKGAEKIIIDLGGSVSLPKEKVVVKNKGGVKNKKA